MCVHTYIYIYREREKERLCEPPVPRLTSSGFDRAAAVTKPLAKRCRVTCRKAAARKQGVSSMLRTLPPRPPPVKPWRAGDHCTQLCQSIENLRFSLIRAKTDGIEQLEAVLEEVARKLEVINEAPRASQPCHPRDLRQVHADVLGHCNQLPVDARQFRSHVLEG